MYPMPDDSKCDEFRRRQKFAVRLAVVFTIQSLLHLLILPSRAHAQTVILAGAPDVEYARPPRMENFSEFAAAIPVGVEVRVETLTGARVQGRVASIASERVILTIRRPLGRERVVSLRAADVRRVVIVRSWRVGGGRGPGARVILGAAGAALAGAGLAGQRGDLLILGMGAGVLAGMPRDVVSGAVEE